MEQESWMCTKQLLNDAVKTTWIPKVCYLTLTLYKALS